MTQIAFPRVAFLVTHLSGSGHFVRVLALARAAMREGAEVLVVSGGRPLPHVPASDVPMVQLPPLAVAGRDFRRMLDPEGREADTAYLGARVAAAEAAAAGFAPHVLVTETWPLGRRRLGAEFEAVVAVARRARPGLRLAVSVRDLPEPPSKPDRLAEAAARLRRGVDALLVHGDAGFLPLSAAWPLPRDLAAITHHTGYVAEPPAPPAPRSGEVLVAVGGGDLGRGVLETAARAAALAGSASGRTGRLRWRLLVGGADAGAYAAALVARHPPAPLTVEPVRPDYRSLLAGAACSVSLAGYNTATDLAPLATPAVLIPDETGGEREQALRAAALAHLPGVAVLRNPDPATLAATVARFAGTRRPPFPIALDGATRSAAILTALAREAAA